ncbi:DNA primase [Patescibacteria group bacterium]|nr:DNA primase [Patescibacteria group bacterium]MBU1663733.1 DNA primase [Patescibacteria group bacterium]MBU1934285.1 DNA primase [Patescibacteria group bacterium]MBU2007506.1 DNA primase [Patescibacteria group bacterium]MBU2233292.1 DNA primase [Patescibacteria group bacterium]
MQNPSEEIKSKLDIVDVIREYIQLKAAGLNFRAHCPFHREKTPSFIVSPGKQIWHCFGCGKGGDVFSFVMEIEGLSFVETLRLLAKKAGVILKKADPALTSKRNALLDILELSAKYYHKILTHSQAALTARKYLHERALTDDTIVKWQIGYSPDTWDSLSNFLKSRGYGENEIFLAGLSVKKEKTPGFYDRFRGRIMFPIHDINGNVAGFTARVSPDKETEEKIGLSAETFVKAGKYINTPATMIYDKSKILFGMDKAKMSIKAEDAAILVEGQMDAITAEQNGFNNIIASSGTALTAEQVNLIKRYSNNLFLSFDMDKAGDLAAERGIAQAMQAEMNIKVIEIQGAKDPDECIKNNPESWRQAVQNAKPMMRYYFDKTFLNLNLKDYEGQNKAEKILLPIIAKFGSKTEQDYWLKKLSQEVDANENFLREKLGEIIKKQNQTNSPVKLLDQAPKELNQLKPSREQMLSELLLAFVIRFPAHLEYVINHIGPEDLAGESNRVFYKNLILYYNKLIDLWTREGENFALAINYLSLKEWLSNADNFTQGGDVKMDDQPDNYKCLSLLDRLVLLADKDFYDYSEEQVRAEIINIAAALKVNYLNHRRHAIAKLIATLEKENISGQGKNEELKNLMEEFKALTEEMNLIEIN